MIRKIVVGIDRSDLGLKALECAIALARSFGADLKLVHVLVDNEPGAPRLSGYLGGPLHPSLSATVVESYQTAWKEFADHAQVLLDQQVAKAQTSGINTSGSLLRGSPGANLCEISQNWNADLIIVGSRGLSGIHKLLIGSVSNHVVHHAPCSVLVIHGELAPSSHQPSSQPRRILVPVDRSDMAKAAIKTAIALAKRYQSEIRLLHVIDADEPGAPRKLIFSDSQYISRHSELLFAEYQQEWNKFINGWWQSLQQYVDEIEAEGLVAICDVMQGRIGQRIADVAEDWPADLIVMGSRGVSGLQELLMGSVSYYVSHRAPCSVLITRPKLATSLQQQNARSVAMVRP